MKFAFDLTHDATGTRTTNCMLLEHGPPIVTLRDDNFREI